MPNRADSRGRLVSRCGSSNSIAVTKAAFPPFSSPCRLSASSARSDSKSMGARLKQGSSPSRWHMEGPSITRYIASRRIVSAGTRMQDWGKLVPSWVPENSKPSSLHALQGRVQEAGSSSITPILGGASAYSDGTEKTVKERLRNR